MIAATIDMNVPKSMASDGHDHGGHDVFEFHIEVIIFRNLSSAES